MKRIASKREWFRRNEPWSSWLLSASMGVVILVMSASAWVPYARFLLPIGILLVVVMIAIDRWLESVLPK